MPLHMILCHLWFTWSGAAFSFPAWELVGDPHQHDTNMTVTVQGSSPFYLHSAPTLPSPVFPQSHNLTEDEEYHKDYYYSSQVRSFIFD